MFTKETQPVVSETEMGGEERGMTPPFSWRTPLSDRVLLLWVLQAAKKVTDGTDDGELLLPDRKSTVLPSEPPYLGLYEY